MPNQAPTAIRALMKFGTEHVKKYDKSSLRVLGSVFGLGLGLGLEVRVRG
jgi:acyl-coenzyme A synthetase/AMP-(fatty) acid ligase